MGAVLGVGFLWAALLTPILSSVHHILFLAGAGEQLRAALLLALTLVSCRRPGEMNRNRE